MTVTYTWDWGDGTVEAGLGAAATHTYADYAGYTITATDTDGLVGPFTLQALPMWDEALWDVDFWGD